MRSKSRELAAARRRRIKQTFQESTQPAWRHSGLSVLWSEPNGTGDGNVAEAQGLLDLAEAIGYCVGVGIAHSVHVERYKTGVIVSIVDIDIQQGVIDRRITYQFRSPTKLSDDEIAWLNSVFEITFDDVYQFVCGEGA